MLCLHTITTGPFLQNGYIIYGRSRKAIIIDPGSDPETYLQVIITNKLSINIILITHGHVDHIGAVETISKKYNVLCWVNQKDAYLVTQANLYAAAFKIMQPVNVPTEFITDTLNPFQLPNEISIQIIETPGHTKGSVCFYLNDCFLFSGDMIFKNKIGRTDLPGGCAHLMQQSITTLAQSISLSTIVFAGHGNSFSINNCEPIIENAIY